MHSGSEFDGESVTVQDEQRLLGEGDSVMHTVVTSELGEVDLPEASPGALAGPIPLIENAPGDAIVLSPGTDEVSEFRAIEISNLSVEGGSRGRGLSRGNRRRQYQQLADR